MLEAKFSASVVSALRHRGFMVNKIETHGTTIGIPDLYCVYGTPIWIELKVVNLDTKNKAAIHVPYRPGQLAWFARHKRLAPRIQLYTLVHTNDEIWLHTVEALNTNDIDRYLKRNCCVIASANALNDIITYIAYIARHIKGDNNE